MTLTNSSRKRECSEETDYMPVTKRMNNLHINVMSNGLHDINDTLIGRQSDPIDGHNYDNMCQRGQTHSHSGVHNGLCVYSPQLDSISNPIYYESNRILFEAHQQRLQRMANTSRQLFFRRS